MTGHPRILHVDDDASIREVVRMMLEGLGGMEVQSVESGRAALEAVLAQRPDLVLLDVMMPEMDGPQTLARLREFAPESDLPVVFLTAKVLRREMTQLQGLGAADIIQKPFRARDLIAALRAVLDRQAG